MYNALIKEALIVYLGLLELDREIEGEKPARGEKIEKIKQLLENWDDIEVVFVKERYETDSNYTKT